jgi:hypothetical protein
VAVLAPDYTTGDDGMNDDDDDEIFQCNIDPNDVPGGYTGLTRKLDLTRTQRRAFKKMWKEGRLIPGESKLRLADIEDVVDLTQEQDTTVTTTSEISELDGVPIDVGDIQIPLDIDVEGLLVDGGGDGAYPEMVRERELQTTGTTSYGPHVGVKHVLVVKVIDVNGKARIETPSQISDDIFGTNGDAVNLKSQMNACSMGRLDILPGDDSAGVVNQDLYDAPGVITVNIDISIETNTRTNVENAITAKVQDKMGMTLPGPYDLIMYVVEKCYVECGYAAYAYVNRYISVYQGVNYKYVGVLMHEIGHNLGLVSSYHCDIGLQCHIFAEV